MDLNDAKTVFVGLSGGVDSSVAALRLIHQGYNVVGVFIKVWHPEWMVCNWEAERLDAMRVAAHLDIPFLTCNAEAAYKQHVADYFVAEYAAGRTPNPDVMCNQAVKFGAFLDFAGKRGADFVATGHYARKETDSNGRHHLLRGVDEKKDQSYFLWTLTHAQLDRILLPIGDTSKENIRDEASAASIPTATKKDSQGICFLGHIDIPEFLGHYIDLTPGEVISAETGAVVGQHMGAFVYTPGQRHGFTLSVEGSATPPHYVVDRDINANTITVSPTPPALGPTDTVTLHHFNEIDPVDTPYSLSAQFRYRQRPVAVTLTKKHGDKAALTVDETVDAPARGQSCVLYEGERCVGGGIIG